MKPPNLTEKLSITCEEEQLEARASMLAESLGLPFVPPGSPAPTPFSLELTAERLQLVSNEKKGPGPLYVDFTEGKLGYRHKHAAGRNEAIAKAVGIKKAYRPSILDLTAGLGRDSFILATLGCQVQMIERSPVIYQLLSDGLARLKVSDDYQEIMERLSLLNTDSLTLKQDVQLPQAEVVYIDPMYPHSDKSALVKKEMRYLREIVGDDQDASELLSTAHSFALKRIVVKRPRLAPHLNEQKPSFSQNGKSTRFDIYIV